jgi:imidazolonepropionase-like amidohydrolase
MLDVETGTMITPGELRVEGGRIVESGAAVSRPPGAEIIDLGDRTLLPG